MKEVFLLALVGLSFLTVREIKAEQYNLSAPGTLSQKVDSAKMSTITELKIVGEMNEKDFVFLRKAAKELIVLDLQEAAFTGGILPDLALYKMYKLTTVTLPFVMEEIGDSAFVGTSMAGALSLPSGLKRIGVGAFAGCSKLTGTLDIPASVLILEDDTYNHKGAFYGCAGFDALVIPAGSKMTRIGSGSFNDCSGLRSVRLSKNIVSIGGGAFSGCTGLTELIDLSSVKYIEGYNSILPGTRGAFEECKKLEGVRIDPNVLLRIGSRAFKNCLALKGSAYIHASVLAESIEAFEGTQMDVHILKSVFIRPDNGTEGFPWCTTYSNFAHAVSLRDDYDDRYFFSEGNHNVSESQYIESNYIALLGGYNGKEGWGESPQGGESKLSLSADSGDVLVFDYNWDVPLHIDVQNITLNGITVVKSAEGNWQGAKVADASFYSPVSLEGDVTFRGKMVYDAFSSSGRVTMDNVTLTPVSGSGYDEETGEFNGLLFSELAITDSLIVEYPLFTNGERTILTTKGDNRPPVDFFHHKVSGRALFPTEQARFKWIQEGEVNKLQMETDAPLTISLVNNEVPVLAFGESLQLGVKFSNEKDQRKASWTSSRPDIVGIGQTTGYITAKKVPSDATVSVTIAPVVQGEQALVSACRVYVAQICFKAVNPRIISPFDSVRLRTDVLPDNLPDPRLIWSVSDTSLATIDSISGILTAGAHIGTVIVTARLRANDKIYATYDIYIAPSSATLLPLFPDTEPLKQGNSYEFKLLVEPDIEDEIAVEYSVSDTTVVVLVGDSIRAVGQGTAVVTACVLQSPYDTLFASFSVTVVNPITHIEIPSSWPVGLGDIFDIPITIFPGDALKSELNWSSDDPTIVNVRKEGGFEALMLGTAQLVVSTDNGLSDTCVVKVGASIIRLNVREINLQEGTSYPLSVSFVPELAYNDIVWTTSDSLVAVVDTKGLVTAVGVGKAEITASTGARIDTCVVNCMTSSANSSFYLMESYKEMKQDEVFTITLINTTGETATWFSDNASVVSVTNDGVVTAHSVGSTAIHVVSSGSFRAACVVSVRNRLSSVEIPIGNEQIYYREGSFFVKGFAGHHIFVVSLSGQTKAVFNPSSDDEMYPFDLSQGVYLLHSVKGNQQFIDKFVVR
ncbi:MAG: leucine-rich repeat protein [Tannerellaceae bacterium]|nr:leucine-rich repeat protein [Tannerellaceae bacterium]